MAVNFCDIKEYFDRMVNSNGTLAVKVKYPKEWVVQCGNYDKITIKGSSLPQEAGIYYFYVVKMDECSDGLALVYEKIYECVERNQELAKKDEIFKEKCKELKEIIMTTPLKKLENLCFTFKKKKKVDMPLEEVEASFDEPVETENNEEDTTNSPENE